MSETYRRKLKTGKTILVRNTRTKQEWRDKKNQYIGMGVGVGSVALGVGAGHLLMKSRRRNLGIGDLNAAKKAGEGIDDILNNMRARNPTNARVNTEDFNRVQKMGNEAKNLDNVVDIKATRFAYYLKNMRRQSSEFSMSRFQADFDRYANEPLAEFGRLGDADKAVRSGATGLRNAIGNVGREIAGKAVAAKNKVAVLVKNANGKAFIQQRWKNVAGAGRGMSDHFKGMPAYARANPGKAGAILAGTAIVATGAAIGGRYIGESINRNTSSVQRAKNDAEADKYNKMLGIKK